jgi:hypothetical protein
MFKGQKAIAFVKPTRLLCAPPLGETAPTEISVSAPAYNQIRDWFQEIAHDIHFLKMDILAKVSDGIIVAKCIDIRRKCLVHENELYSSENLPNKALNFDAPASSPDQPSTAQN